jgi:hypothetical protein
MLRSIVLGACAAAVLTGALDAPVAAATKSYTLKDYGSPPASLLSAGNTTPLTFNNTGQLAGLGSTAADPGQVCIAYTGSKWVVAQVLTARTCTPYAMSDLHGGTFDIVGSIASEFEGGPSAFYTSATASAATMQNYSFAGGSALTSITRGGYAFGWGNYETPASANVPDLAFSSSGNGFGPIEACISLARYCPGAIETGPTVSRTSGFHLRSINSSYTYLALDLGTNFLMEGTLNKPSASFDLGIKPSALACFVPVGIDDQGAFYYQECPEPKTSVRQYAYRYDPSTKRNALIPPLAGSDCLVYVPYAVNGKGEVFGYNGDCTRSTGVDWIYEPATKTTSNLDAQLPTVSGSTYTLEAINDLGQLLISLDVPSGPNHWAVLIPPT